MKKQSFSILLLALIAVLLLSGCQATTGYYRGADAADMMTLRLADAVAQEQVWEDLYLRVVYNLQQNADQVEINGNLTFSDSARTNYSRVKDLKLKLFLLDADMRVVAYDDIARTLSYSLEETTSFKRVLSLDRSVVALAIGYEGILAGGGFDAPGGQAIWEMPKRQR